MYRNILDDLNIKQQLCIIHLRRTTYTKLKHYKRRSNLTKEETEQIYLNAKEFTEIFHETNYYIAKQKYEQYINKYNEIPEILQQFMQKTRNQFHRQILTIPQKSKNRKNIK